MIKRGWFASGWVGAASLVALVVAAGCGADLGPGSGDAGVPDDLGDLAVEADLAPPPDLAPAPDLLPTFTYAGQVKSLQLTGNGWMQVPVKDVSVCLYPGVSGALCATSDEQGGFVLANLPEDTDIAISAKKDGYVPQLVDLRLVEGASPGAILLVDSATLSVLAQLARVTVDLKKGLVLMHVVDLMNGEYSGARAHLDLEGLTDGPFYITGGSVERDTTTSSALAMVGWFNVPPGDYDASNTDRDGAACQLRTGWAPMDKAKVVRLRVVAGFMTVVTTRC